LPSGNAEGPNSTPSRHPLEQYEGPLWGKKAGSRRQARAAAVGSVNGPLPGRLGTTRMRRKRACCSAEIQNFRTADRVKRPSAGTGLDLFGELSKLRRCCRAQRSLGRPGNARLRIVNRMRPVPNLENLKKQAKLYLRWHRDQHYPVAARIRAVLPRFRHLSDREILAHSFRLSDAQELVARKTGFECAFR
jgi:hypothetical protein